MLKMQCVPNRFIRRQIIILAMFLIAGVFVSVALAMLIAMVGAGMFGTTDAATNRSLSSESKTELWRQYVGSAANIEISGVESHSLIESWKTVVGTHVQDTDGLGGTIDTTSLILIYATGWPMRSLSGSSIIQTSSQSTNSLSSTYDIYRLGSANDILIPSRPSDLLPKT
jgi:hypothetical protein